MQISDIMVVDRGIARWNDGGKIPDLDGMTERRSRLSFPWAMSQAAVPARTIANVARLITLRSAEGLLVSRKKI